MEFLFLFFLMHSQPYKLIGVIVLYDNYSSLPLSIQGNISCHFIRSRYKLRQKCNWKSKLGR